MYWYLVFSRLFYNLSRYEDCICGASVRPEAILRYRVNYGKLFGELLKRVISPIVLRLLLYMYTSQTLRVKWGHTVSNYLTVRNEVKQGGALSPLLFAIYTDSILKRLEESGVGCHMGGHFTGALAYADDITSPSISGLRTLSKVCEEYETEFDVTFNGKTIQLLFFRGRECVFSNLNIYVCGQLIDIQIRKVLLNQQNLVSGEF